jgi:2,3-diketo-5-methylthio-1-phosphopentane phosphatase
MVFFDFDNTVTLSDILDNVISRFANGEDWKYYENAWEQGKIGSRECLEKQLRELRVTKERLSEYLAEIMIDPNFGKLLKLLRSRGIQFMIVSDSFSFLIREILKHNGIRGIKVYANKLNFRDDELSPSFPLMNKDCLRCAHCKRRHVLEHADKTTVYVGDGLSDVCPAQYTDLVFAKAKLADFFHKNKKPFMKFRDLGDVYGFFEDLEPVKTRSKKNVSRS